MENNEDLFSFDNDSDYANSIPDERALVLDKREQGILEREEFYSSIVQNYSNNLEKSLEFKNKGKSCFFIFSCTVLFLSMVTYCITLIRNYDALAIISASISFITALIDIPIIIAKYLFNTDEEKYMSEIISSIQTYDLNGRKK